MILKTQTALKQSRERVATVTFNSTGFSSIGVSIKRCHGITASVVKCVCPSYSCFMKKFSSPHISYRLVLFDVEACLHQLDELTTCLVHSPPILTCRAFLYHSKAILTSDHKNVCIWRCIYQENKNLSSSKDNISSVGIISIEIFVNKMVYLFKSNFWA